MASVVEDFCNQLAATPVGAIPVLRFPPSLRIQPPVRFARPAQGLCDITDDLNALIAPAMASLRPLFTVIAVLNELMNCFRQLPTSVGSSPTKLNKFLTCMAKLFPKLLELLAELAQLIPPISVPQLVMDILRALVSLLDCVLAVLASLQSLSNLVANALLAPENNRQLLLAQCTRQNIDLQLGNLALAMAAVVMTLCLVKNLLALVPGGQSTADQIPPTPTMSLNVVAFSSDIGRFMTVVRTTRDLIGTIAGAPGVAAVAGIAAFVPQGTTADLFVGAFISGAGDPDSNGDLIYAAPLPGAAGNGTRVRQRIETGAPHPHAAPAFPAVSVSGTDLTVDLETAAGPVVLSTATVIRDLVNATPAASALVEARLATTTSTGAGLAGKTQDDAFENLSGGLDAPVLTEPILSGSDESFKCG